MYIDQDPSTTQLGGQFGPRLQKAKGIQVVLSVKVLTVIYTGGVWPGNVHIPLWTEFLTHRSL